MSEGLYLSRASLRRDVPAAALRALLIPRGDAARVHAGHHLVWTLFADHPARSRDFLWREADEGVFYILSRRIPEDPHGLFDLEPPKAFAPDLRTGDRLAFCLRANATISRAEAAGGRGKRCDVVMHAIHGVPPDQRAAARMVAVQEEGVRWLRSQGERSGFAIPADPEEPQARPRLNVTSYRVLSLGPGRREGQLGVLDFEGELEVRHPGDFLRALEHGFGRAKAFGCGLMLIRRISARGR